MGGRGSFSYGGVVWGGDINIGKGGGEPGLLAAENRKELADLAVAAGFTRAMGTSGVDEEVMRNSLNRIRQLEGKYGVLAESEDPVLVGSVEDNAIAYVDQDYGNNRAQNMGFSPTKMGDAQKLYDAQLHGQSSGWFMPSRTDRATLLGYTATHEYGHMLENVLYQRYRDAGGTKSEYAWASDVRDDVMRLAGYRGYTAGRNYKSLSTYGGKNAYEFFAEAFANANSGAENRIGRALNTWLERQGY